MVRVGAVLAGVVVGFLFGVYVTIGIPCALAAADDACIPVHGLVTVPACTYLGGRIARRLHQRVHQAEPGGQY